MFGHLFPIWLRRDRKALIVIAVVAFGLASMLTQTSLAWQLIGAVALLAVTPMSWGPVAATALAVANMESSPQKAI